MSAIARTAWSRLELLEDWVHEGLPRATECKQLRAAFRLGFDNLGPAHVLAACHLLSVGTLPHRRRDFSAAQVAASKFLQIRQPLLPPEDHEQSYDRYHPYDTALSNGREDRLFQERQVSFSFFEFSVCFDCHKIASKRKLRMSESVPPMQARERQEHESRMRQLAQYGNRGPARDYYSSSSRQYPRSQVGTVAEHRRFLCSRRPRTFKPKRSRQQHFLSEPLPPPPNRGDAPRPRQGGSRSRAFRSPRRWIRSRSPSDNPYSCGFRVRDGFTRSGALTGCVVDLGRSTR